MAITKTRLVYGLLGLILVVLAAVILGLSACRKEHAEVDLPPLSDIQEMRADTYNSPELFDDFFNYFIPKEYYEQILAYFKPAKEGSFHPDWEEMGRLTIKCRSGRTFTIVFYGGIDGPLPYSTTGRTYTHNVRSNVGEGLALQQLLRDIRRKEK